MSSVVKVGRYAGALAAVTAALAGCGGSSRTATTTSRITLPLSSNGPTTCTVYESGYATQVIFESESFDVRAECRAWTHNNPGGGYLWGYQPASAASAPAESTQVCSLRGPDGDVAARVIEATGFRSVSPVEAANGSSACVSLLTVGWTKQAPR
jgi:hypothetical protein